MPTSSSPPDCPDCGAPLPASSHSLCPACLLRQALASGTATREDEALAAAPPLSPQEIAARFQQFEILECLGRGGMGVVYKARQKSLNRLVAIKILDPALQQEPKFAERFAREAELLARFNHPHIVTIHDFGEAEGLFYLVMEYVDGMNLRELLRGGKLGITQALAIIPPLCDALQYAHSKGIVHRDIKPENLLIDREGRVKIADFGIAMLLGAGGEWAGTPPYMAPEQANLAATSDHRADLYSLGVVLYEMLTGERPGKNLIVPSRKVQSDVRIDKMVLRALEQAPELRYQTAAEFRSGVEAVTRPEAPPADPPLVVAEIGATAAAEWKRRVKKRWKKVRKSRRKKVIFHLLDEPPSKPALLGLAVLFLVLGLIVLFCGITITEQDPTSEPPPLATPDDYAPPWEHSPPGQRARKYPK